MPQKNIILLITLFGFSIGNAQNDLDRLLSRYNNHEVPYISVEELKMQKRKDSIWILDAREPEEFKVSHLANAYYVGYNSFSEEETSKLISNKNAPIVVYCSIGIRSENIAAKLKKAGFSNVSNLYGGIFAWKNKDYPVFDMQNEETENVHAYSKSWSKWLKKGKKVYPKK